MNWKRRSVDLRQQALSAWEKGMSTAEVRALFGVSRSTLYRWKERQDEGSLADKPTPGGPRRIAVESEVKLLAQLEAFPDDTIMQHRERWERRHGQAVSSTTMRRTIKRLDWTRKKSQ